MRLEASLTQYTVSAALCFWERQFGALSGTVVSGLWDFLKDFCLQVEALGGGHFSKTTSQNKHEGILKWRAVNLLEDNFQFTVDVSL